MRIKSVIRVLAASCLGAAPVACSTPPRKTGVVETNMQVADINGMSDVRFVPSIADGIQAYLNELKVVAPKRDHYGTGAAHYLSLSGGGDNGAFGAGLLAGWTQQGTRPEFDQVVGISTGSLIAPFAFLGSDYDQQLQEVFTTIKPSDIYTQRRLLSIIFNDGLADNTPLLRLIEKNITGDLLEKIAIEYEKKGRLLLIGTTNIDNGQLVIWNMGKIAALRTPASASLFHHVMLASAAVPGLFPPELFDATVGGVEFDELHVDGGLAVQLYLYPAAVSKQAVAQGLLKPRQRSAYIIRNASITVGHEDTERNGIDVLNRSYKKIIQSQGVGNLYQIYQIAHRDKVDFNLAFIGDDFKAKHPAEFDQMYMQSLFRYGYDKAVQGYPWGKTPPGYEQSTEQDIKAQNGKQK